MSSSTIRRAFNAQPSQMIHEAKKLANSNAYAVKKFFYNLVTFGRGKAIQDARADRREMEVVTVATDVLKDLPVDYSKLTNPADKDKVLHTNMEKKYQIILEGKALCLYTGTVSHSWFGNSNSEFKKDPASKEILKTISSDLDLTTLKRELTIIKEYKELSSKKPELPKSNILILATQLTQAKSEKNRFKAENITQKTDIVFHGNGGKFNPSWEEHPKNITENNYNIEQIRINNENICKISNNNPDQFILIVAGSQSAIPGKKLVTDQITKFFSKYPDKTLEDFLKEPVAVNDSAKYRLLKSACQKNMDSEDTGNLYPLFEHELDNY